MHHAPALLHRCAQRLAVQRVHVEEAREFFHERVIAAQDLRAIGGTRALAEDRDAGQQAGADEYLIKPFSPLQLIETIERLMQAV